VTEMPRVGTVDHVPKREVGRAAKDHQKAASVRSILLCTGVDNVLLPFLNPYPEVEVWTCDPNNSYNSAPIALERGLDVTRRPLADPRAILQIEVVKAKQAAKAA
jgi:hypothetical protein